MKQPDQHSALTYIDHDGAHRTVRGCTLTVDSLDRHWIWCEQTKSNLVYKTKGRENALLAALDSALFHIHLKDQQIAALQRISDLAHKFANEVNQDENE